MLRKGIYPYEYTDKQEKFNKTTLLEKQDFYNNLNMQDVTGYIIIMPKDLIKILK